MKFLPFERISYITKLHPEQISLRMRSITTEKKLLVSPAVIGSGKPYAGTVDDHSFCIMRIITYRNSFLPVITGTVEKDLQTAKTVIKITMRLPWFVFCFLCVWFGGVFLASVTSLFYLAAHLIAGTHFDTSLIIPFVMLFVAYIPIIAAFKYECRKAKQCLEELLETEKPA